MISTSHCKSFHGYNEIVNQNDSHFKQLKSEIQENTSEIQKWVSLIKNQNNVIENYWRSDQKCNSVRINDKYCEYYKSLISKLKELFQCPLSLDHLYNPMILPSGFTINESYLNRLINCKDPYNMNLIVSNKIVNRFANDVKDIIDKSEKSVFEDEIKMQNEISNLDIQRLQSFKETQPNYSYKNYSMSNLKGLNQVSRDLRYDTHNFSAMFTRYMKENSPNWQNYGYISYN